MGTRLWRICEIICATLLAVEVHATTIVVDQAGSAAYTTVSSGINAANEGDTVYVLAGYYSEYVDIAKSITLSCEGPDLVTIANPSGYTIVIERSKAVTITGCGVTGAQVGISVKQSAFLTLTNNVIFGNGQDGIRTLESGVSSVVIQNNTVSLNSGTGIDMPWCLSSGCPHTVETAIIENNIISSNAGTGILSQAAGTLIERYNIVFSNGTNYNFNSGVAASLTDIGSNPQFVNAIGGDFRLQAASPARNAGRPGALLDPDGTQNDIGAYGGPGSAGFFPSPEGGPTVRSMAIFPSSVPKGGSITVQATGRANVP